MAKPKLNLGNPEFNRKMIVYYSWVTPIAFSILLILFLITMAWIPSLAIAFIVILTLPVLSDFWKRVKIKGTVKVVLVVALLVLALYSTKLYV